MRLTIALCCMLAVCVSGETLTDIHKRNMLAETAYRMGGLIPQIKDTTTCDAVMSQLQATKMIADTAGKTIDASTAIVWTKEVDSLMSVLTARRAALKKTPAPVEDIGVEIIAK